MAPVVDEIAALHTDRIAVEVIDTSENPALAVQYNVMSVPTLLGLVDGRVALQQIGYGGRDRVAKMFSDLNALTA